MSAKKIQECWKRLRWLWTERERERDVGGRERGDERGLDVWKWTNVGEDDGSRIFGEKD